MFDQFGAPIGEISCAFSSFVMPAELDRPINSDGSTTVSLNVAPCRRMRHRPICQWRISNLNSRSTVHRSRWIANLVDEALLTHISESGRSIYRISCGNRNRTTLPCQQLPNCWQIVGIRRRSTFISEIKTEV